MLRKIADILRKVASINGNGTEADQSGRRLICRHEMRAKTRAEYRMSNVE
jgi:hypothetical protein